MEANTATTEAGHEAASLADPLGEASAAARFREYGEPPGTMIALHTGQATDSKSPLCVIRPRGMDLVLTGEIDLRNAAEIESRVLLWLHGADNHLDLTGVDFIDSMGIVVLLRIYAAAKRLGANLRISSSTTVYAVLSMAGLTEHLPGLTLTRSDND